MIRHFHPVRTNAGFAWLALAAVVLTSGCGAARGADAPASPAPQHVDTVVARRGSVSPTMRIAGVVAPHRQVGVSSVLSEPIAQVLVAEGDRVTRGQVLATLLTDDLASQLASAQSTANEGVARARQQEQQSVLNGSGYRGQLASAGAALAQAKSALAGAVLDRHRYVVLRDQGYVSAQVVAQQNTTVQQDRQAVYAASMLLGQAERTTQLGTAPGGLESTQIDAARAAAASAQSAVEGLRRQIARATIVAPVDGTVEAVNANVGEYPSGRQLFTLHDDGAAYALLAAASSEAMRIRPGQYVGVLLAGGTIHAPGRVEAMLDQLAPGSTNYTVKVAIGETKETVLPGMPVDGIVHLAAVGGTIVPISAYADEMHEAVFVVRDGKAHQQKIDVLAEDGTNAVVRGLSPGAHVVKDGQGGVGDGDDVRS